MIEDADGAALELDVSEIDGNLGVPSFSWSAFVSGWSSRLMFVYERVTLLVFSVLYTLPCLISLADELIIFMWGAQQSLL